MERGENKVFLKYIFFDSNSDCFQASVLMFHYFPIHNDKNWQAHHSISFGLNPSLHPMLKDTQYWYLDKMIGIFQSTFRFVHWFICFGDNPVPIMNAMSKAGWAKQSVCQSKILEFSALNKTLFIQKSVWTRYGLSFKK